MGHGHCRWRKESLELPSRRRVMKMMLGWRSGVSGLVIIRQTAVFMCDSIYVNCSTLTGIVHLSFIQSHSEHFSFQRERTLFEIIIIFIKKKRKMEKVKKKINFDKRAYFGG
jgi:hypothetical protein